MGGKTTSSGSSYGNSTSSTSSDLPKPESGSSGSNGSSSSGGSGLGKVIQKTLSKTDISSKSPSRSPSERQVENAHKNFAESKSVENYEIRKVAEGKQEIESLLEKHFEIKDNHMFGSLTRGTIIGPLDMHSDADIMYVLDDEHKKWIEKSGGAEECLDAFKEALEGKILNAESVKIDRNVVTVQFSDYKIEVAPSFDHPQGGYMIPDLDANSRQWIRTAPRMYKEMFESVDQKQSGDLKKMVRNVKTWAENNNVPARSYHLEAIAFQHMKSFSSDVHIDLATEDFFANLPQYLRSSFRDPAIQEEHLDEYLNDGDRRDAIEKAQEAREKMMDAKEMKENGNGNSAVEKLDELFGKSD